MKDWEQLQNKTTIEAWRDSGTDDGGGEVGFSNNAARPSNNSLPTASLQFNIALFVFFPLCAFIYSAREDGRSY